MKELLFFAPIYGLAFLAMFAIRRALSLAVALPGALLLTAVLVNSATEGKGEAGLGLYLMGVTAALGFLAGAAARAALLVIRRRTQRVPAAAVALLFLFGFPLGLRLWGAAQ